MENAFDYISFVLHKFLFIDRSFEPILRLVQAYDTPEAQHWAVWALCNLTHVYRKYSYIFDTLSTVSL